MATGCFYSGEWLEDKRHGYGDENYQCGSIYKGKFSNGAKQGHGTFTMSSGYTYSGEWLDNKKSGFGTEVHPNRVAVFVGNFENNLRSGPNGILTSQNGDYYKGSWLNDQMHGVGEEHYTVRRERYFGAFRN